MAVTREAARRRAAVYFEAPAVRVLKALRVNPNSLTLAGLLVAVVTAYLLSQGFMAAAAAALVASALFDQLDGSLARATGQVSKFGGLLDSVVDRAAEAVVLLGLLAFYLDRSADLEAALVYATFATSVSVSYVRARASGMNVDCDIGVMTRVERMMALVIAVAVGQWWLDGVAVGLGVIAALSAVTVVQRVLHVRAELRRRGTP